MTALADSRPYATWLIAEDGVWRADPKGEDVLLRYLPATLSTASWKQRSGDADVWFLLQDSTQTCQAFSWVDISPSGCWNLTVLNRGEKLTYTFAEGVGPILVKAENWADPASSFTKRLWKPSPEPVGQARPQALPPTNRAPVTPATAEAFREAELAMLLDEMKDGVIRSDLDGDGERDYIAAPSDTWTTAPLIIYRADGSPLAEFLPYPNGSRHRTRAVQFSGLPQALLLHEHQPDDQGPHQFGLYAYLNGTMQWLYGWESKSQRAPGHRVSIDGAGIITVEWDMGDPARHTRIRQYALEKDGSHLSVKAMSTRYVPQGEDLIYPGTPQEVLQAAFFARWFGLRDELSRYFSSPEETAVLADHPEIQEPSYQPGQVWLGSVTLPAPPGSKWPPVSPEPIGPDGTTGFFAHWGFYESGTEMWGKVTFGTNKHGQPVIIKLIIEGSRHTSV
ncbi:MAG TPA: hypothetical protein VD973_00715 [Symbiobacteriaceae bacterium]|nr:hypothetical protein [Symbiobacteriaceae bacterium]